MRTSKHRPAMAQQIPNLSNLLILAQLLSLFGNSIRNGFGRFLDFLILFARL